MQYNQHPSEADIVGRVVRQAEYLEGIDSPDEMNILEVEYAVSDRGIVTGVDLVLTVGGPTIIVESINGVVKGSWGGDRHRTHFDSDVVEQYGRMLADQFERRID